MPMTLQQGIHRRAVAHALVVVLVAAILGGCVSTPLVFVDDDVLITLVGNDRVAIGGQRMALTQAIRRLRSHPVPTDTVIKIRHAPGTSNAAMGQTLRALQQAGYSRIVFIGKRHIDVQTP